MTNAKRKRQKISIDRWITLVWGVVGILGYILWISSMIGPSEPQPPAIQDGIRISRPVVSVGEMVPARVIVNDPDLPDDEIKYVWSAQRGRIGEQLERFQGPEVLYVAPDSPGVDVIEVMVYDRKNKTDRDFYIVTIVEAGGLGSP